MSDDEDFEKEWQQDLDRPYGQYAIWCGLVAFAAVAFALYLQHFNDMLPCAWCTLQRLLFIVLGALAVIAGLMAGTPVLARILTGLATITGLAGLAAALYQHFVAAPGGSCALTFADKVINSLGLHEMMPWMFEAGAMCDEANMPFLGVPFALWSAFLFLILSAVLALVTFSRGPLR